MTTTSVCFSISGEFLTQLVRQWVIEDRSDEALNLLLKDLHGMTADIAFQILRGEKKLIGDSSDPDGVILATESAKVKKAYQDQLRWKFAGYFKHKTKWYRPYAYVSNWGKNDVNRDIVKQMGVSRTVKNIHDSKHYADNYEYDIVVNLKYPHHSERLFRDKHVPILCGHVSAVPVWWYEPKTAQEALDEMLQQRYRLEERGHCQRYGTGLESTSSKTKTLRKAIKQVKKIRKDLKAGKKPVLETYDWEAEENKREKAYQERCVAIRDQVRKQADAMEDGWLTMPIRKSSDSEEFTIAKVPAAPFIHWALSRTGAYQHAPEWNVVSPSGMKMAMDDPYHTDWMLGAGFDLRKDYDHDSMIYKSSYELLSKIQDKYLAGGNCTLLSGKGSTTGRVVKPKPNETVPAGSIAVIPNGGPDYTMVVLSIGSGAIITEVGGKLCHLATISREQNVKIVQMNNAMNLYKENDVVNVDCDNRDVSFSYSKFAISE